MLSARWPLLALIASGAMLAAAHAFETFGHMAPCALCLQQREIYWGAIGVAIAGLLAMRFQPRLNAGRVASLMLGMVFMAGAAVAAYHVAVEHHWVIARCDAVTDPGQITAWNAGGSLERPRCDTPAWTLFGVSMAGYNVLISLGLAALSFIAAVKNRA